MIHAWLDSTASSARRRHDGRKLGLVFALLVMCLAVLPHVTLAASMMRATMPGHIQAAESATEVNDAADIPCHQATDSAPAHASPPPCCIVGCGLIAEAPSAPLLPVMVSWTRAIPPSAATIRGLSPEPAEHPPRSDLPAT